MFKPIRQSSDLAKGHSSRPMFKSGELSANSHRQAKYAETRSRPSARPMRAMQSEEYKNRSSVTEYNSAKSDMSVGKADKIYNPHIFRTNQRHQSSCERVTEYSSNSESEADSSAISGHSRRKKKECRMLEISSVQIALQRIIILPTKISALQRGRKLVDQESVIIPLSRTIVNIVIDTDQHVDRKRVAIEIGSQGVT